MTLTTRNKRTVKKVIKGLNKASKSHTKQASKLQKMVRPVRKKK